MIKAAIGFIKVAAVRLPQTDLAAQLLTLVPALLHCCDDEDGFNRFRSKVRVVMERMVKRCGWDAVEAVTPSFTRIVQHIDARVRTEGEGRRPSPAASSAAGPSPSRVSPPALRASPLGTTRVFSDDDGQTMRTGAGSITVAAAAGVPTRWRRRREGTRAAAGRGARRRLTRFVPLAVRGYPEPLQAPSP